MRPKCTYSIYYERPAQSCVISGAQLARDLGGWTAIRMGSTANSWECPNGVYIPPLDPITKEKWQSHSSTSSHLTSIVRYMEPI